MSTALRRWFERLSGALAPGASGGDGEWVERMILHATGELTPTEEYVYRHGVWLRKREGESIPGAIERGEWSGSDRAEFPAEGSAETVERVLGRLEGRGLLHRVDPPDAEGEYWRLTDAGRAERERIVARFREELEGLQRRYGIAAAEV